MTWLITASMTCGGMRRSSAMRVAKVLRRSCKVHGAMSARVSSLALLLLQPENGWVPKLVNTKSVRIPMDACSALRPSRISSTGADRWTRCSRWFLVRVARQGPGGAVHLGPAHPGNLVAPLPGQHQDLDDAREQVAPCWPGSGAVARQIACISSRVRTRSRDCSAPGFLIPSVGSVWMMPRSTAQPKSIPR